jgi:hypothetical protein
LIHFLVSIDPSSQLASKDADDAGFFTAIVDCVMKSCSQLPDGADVMRQVLNFAPSPLFHTPLVVAGLHDLRRTLGAWMVRRSACWAQCVCCRTDGHPLRTLFVLLLQLRPDVVGNTDFNVKVGAERKCTADAFLRLSVVGSRGSTQCGRIIHAAAGSDQKTLLELLHGEQACTAAVGVCDGV